MCENGTESKSAGFLELWPERIDRNPRIVPISERHSPAIGFIQPSEVTQRVIGVLGQSLVLEGEVWDKKVRCALDSMGA